MANRHKTPSRKDLLTQVNNKFVQSFDEKTQKITYTKDFYVFMKKNLENGMTDVQAYEACGFDITKTGENRAHKAARKARKMDTSERPVIDGLIIFDGSKTREYYGTLTPEEELSYYKCRTIYLEACNRLIKKKKQELVENGMYYPKK